MVADGPGGVDGDAIAESGFLDHFAENDLGGRRTADISHADEEDAVRLAVVGHRR